MVPVSVFRLESELEFAFAWALAAACSFTDWFTASEDEESVFDAFCMAVISVLLPSMSFWAASMALASASRVDSSATAPSELASNVRASAMAFCNETVVLVTLRAFLLDATAVAAVVTALVCFLIAPTCLLILRACVRSAVSDWNTEQSLAASRF